MATYNASGELLVNQYYNCQDYGVVPSNLDNTKAMQNLVNLVYANGGGTIWVPIGVYFFDAEMSNWDLNGNMNVLIEMKKRVSIVGESIDRSIFKVTGTTKNGTTLFAQHSGTSGEVLTGATYSNFTVDMSEASLTTYSHKGKAFHYSGIKDCVFRDLRLLSTPSTSLGIDMLDNVVMDSIYVYQGGRQWSSGGAGGAGIGIGTGKWDNENYVIRNCVCDSCGHFGIFLEDQGLFESTPALNYPKGMIIANNIVRNGRNYGIGLRGGKYALVTGNNVYNNANGGIYLDFGADSSAVVGNLVSGEVNGLCFGNETELYVCNKISVTGNTFIGCKNDIVKTIEPTNSVIENNVTIA